MDILTNPSPGTVYGFGSAENRILGDQIPAVLGVEAQWEYNGLILNNYEWIDTYLIKSIDGLGDSDIRTSSEVNPGAHGETPFNSLYGGSTLVFNGKIQTRTLNKLRNMERALKQAFSPLVEMPLIQRTGDLSRDLFIMCRKHQPMVKGEEQTTPNHYERSIQISLRASNPWFLSYIQEYTESEFTAGFASLDLINLGDFEAQPSFEINGPADAGLEIINSDNNHVISTTIAIPDGDVYTIDTSKNTVKNLAGELIDGAIDSDSDNLRLLEDTVNTIEITANGTDSGSLAIAKWRHTYKV